MSSIKSRRRLRRRANTALHYITLPLQVLAALWLSLTDKDDKEQTS